MYKVAGLILAFLLLCIFFLYQEYQPKTVFPNQEFQERIAIPEKKDVMDILIFGDVMLDRAVREYIHQNTTQSLFKNVSSEIDKADITLINLEGPITKNHSVVTKTNFQFTFATHTAQDLSDIGIDVVSLSNNHAHNFGRQGLLETKEYLTNAGVAFFGDPYNKAGTTYTHTKGKTNVSFIGFHQFEAYDISVLLEEIRELKKQNHFIVFYPHWGEEYKLKANATQEGIAKEVLAAGVDIVIGAHPHVIQNVSLLQNKLAFYSLGNFIFDQWFSKDVQYGLALKLSLENNVLNKVELKPFFRERFEPVFLSGEEKDTWCEAYLKVSLMAPNTQSPCIIEMNRNE